MFLKVRWQLAFLHTAIVLSAVLLLGGVIYVLLSLYLQATVDLALLHKMAHEYEQLNLPLPAELVTADEQWAYIGEKILPFKLSYSASQPDLPLQTDDQGNTRAEMLTVQSLEEAYDGELAAVFLLPLDAQGKPLSAVSPQIALPDQAAVQSALRNRVDWRTVQPANGPRLRLLTYHLPTTAGVRFLQLGRSLGDQDRLMRQLLFGTITIGALVALLAGASSWWLVARPLRPAQTAFERQRLFVANASHELRTPLTLIRASMEVAQSTPNLSAEYLVLLKDVLAATDHMTQLVNDLLLLSRLEAKQFTLECQPVAIAELFTALQRQSAPLAEAHELRLQVKSAEGLAWADPMRLHQVMLILIDNAIRYTPRGGTVTLAAKVTGGSISLSVTDTGIGIAPAHLPHVFESFYRVERTPTDGCAGLGLSIAKALIEAQQGKIQLESQLARGTTVRLSLPVVASAIGCDPTGGGRLPKAG